MIVGLFLVKLVERRGLKPAIADLIQEIDSTYQVIVQNGEDAGQSVIRNVNFFFRGQPETSGWRGKNLLGLAQTTFLKVAPRGGCYTERPVARQARC